MNDNLPTRNVSDRSEQLRVLAAEVMSITDITVANSDEYTARFRGRLLVDSQRAYESLEKGFRRIDHTPLFRLEGDDHVIVAAPGVVDPKPSNPWVSVALFAATLITVMLAGVQVESVRPQDVTLWSFLRLLLTGVPFAASLLGILVAHEMGHYFAARWHGAPVTLPYFIPLPGGLFGTMGAVIKMKAPIRNRRALLDIGIAGPLAGFVVAVPVLLIGLGMSELATLPETGFSMEGNSIMYLLTKYVVHGKLLPEPTSYGGLPPAIHWIVYFFTGQPTPAGSIDVLVHPVAWAGWAGLLVTGLNLIPVGQLDGGHTLYVLLGSRVRKLFPVVVGALILMGFIWRGWWFWAVLIYAFGRQHAKLLDEITPLDSRRRVLAVGTLLLFFFLVTPIPLTSY